jgi:CBS domain-containing protein
MPAHDALVTPADRINPMLTTADVMTPAPRTCSTFSTALEAVLIFRDADCGLVPVLEDGKPVGVLTDRDVALALADRRDALPATPVAEVMTRGVVTVPPDAALDVVQERFGDRGGVRRLLVVDDDGRLLGVIAWSDISPHVSATGIGEVAQQVVERPGSTTSST